nr:MAG TPA: hypothetical protein [Caudoviricetes sp.]
MRVSAKALKLLKRVEKRVEIFSITLNHLIANSIQVQLGPPPS